jgi:hypothetical protein
MLRPRKGPGTLTANGQFLCCTIAMIPECPLNWILFFRLAQWPAVLSGVRWHVTVLMRKLVLGCGDGRAVRTVWIKHRESNYFTIFSPLMKLRAGSRCVLKEFLSRVIQTVHAAKFLGMSKEFVSILSHDHCATNRKVAGSILDVVAGIFQWLNPSGRIVVLGSTQSLTEMSTRNPSWG